MTCRQDRTYDRQAMVRGDSSTRALALVFTGGSHGAETGDILDALRDTGVTAAFFFTGDYLQVPQHQSWVRRMVAEGHYVGPHSHRHLLYCSWDDRDRSLVSEAEFRADLTRNIRDLRSLGALPAGQPIYFIPPYEWFNADQVRWARQMDVVLINFTPGTGSNRDWIPEGRKGFVSSDRIRRDILKFERDAENGLNGFLLLLHVGSLRQDTMSPQVPGLITELQARGYEFVRVDKLLAPDARRAAP